MNQNSCRVSGYPRDLTIYYDIAALGEVAFVSKVAQWIVLLTNTYDNEVPPMDLKAIVIYDATLSPPRNHLR